MKFFADQRIIINLEKLFYAEKKDVPSGKKMDYFLILYFGDETDTEVAYGTARARDEAYERIVRAVEGAEHGDPGREGDRTGEGGDTEEGATGNRGGDSQEVGSESSGGLRDVS